MSTLTIDDLYHPEGEDYLPFQGVDIFSMAERLAFTGVLLANEMGTGKTIEACGLINLMRPKSVVIICPNNLRYNWLEELQKWVEPSLFATLSDGEVEMCTPSMYMHGVSSLVIASYEGLTRWISVLKELDPDIVFIDEGHWLKNPGTKRAKALLELGHWRGKVIMTGTPIPNYPYELFNLINFLNPQQWPSRREFEQRYCPYKNKYAYHMDELQDLLRNGKVVRQVEETFKDLEFQPEPLSPGPLIFHCASKGCSFLGETQIDAEAHCRENFAKGKVHLVEARQTSRAVLRARPTERTKYRSVRSPGVMIRRLKKEVLPELPKKRRQVIGLPAEGRLLELVLKEKEMFEQALRADRELEEILTGDIAETDDEFERKIERLRFTRKYFFDEIAIIRHELAKAKVPYVIEHIEELLETKEKLVCFIHHRDVGEAIRDHFAGRSVLVYGGMGQSDIYAAKDKFWNDDSCELFIGSLKMAGVGLNLQVASNIVFAELDWVPGTITQAEDRCHRIGQENPLLIQHLVAHDSMDSNMAHRIIRKQKTINAALNRPLREAAV